MTGSRTFVPVGLRRLKCVLPWIGVLLVSSSFAYALNGALTGSWAIADGPTTLWTAPGDADLSAPGVSPGGDAARDSSHPCVTLFGSYNGWLFSSGRHGPCGLDPDTTPESLSGGAM